MTFRQLAPAFAAAALLSGSLTAFADPTSPRQFTRVGEVAVIAPTATAPSAKAARVSVIYSNFEKAVAPFQNSGYLLYGPANSDGAGKQFVATPFVSKANSAITDIAIAVAHEAASSVQLSLRIGLYADAAGVPGALIASWPLATVVDYTAGNISYPVIKLPQGSTVALTAGTTYWIAADTAADSDFIGQWAYTTSNNGKAKNGPVAYWNDYTNGGWKPMTSAIPALAIYGTTTP